MKSSAAKSEAGQGPAEQDGEIECPKLQNTFEGQNFLDVVDEEILFIDDSIEFSLPTSETTDAVAKEAKPVSSTKSSGASESMCFGIAPTPLNTQLVLPIKDLQHLFFYETFLLNRPLPNSNPIPNLIPQHDEIDELGNASILVEGVDEDNILIYVNIQMLDNGGTNVSHEELSIVDNNLKLVHEKRVDRSCVNGNISEKSLHTIALNDGNYQMIKTETKMGTTEQSKANVKWTQDGDFLCCGANVLMTRRLVLDNFVGCIQTLACDIEGEFHLSQHWFLKNESTNLAGKEFDVKQVDRLLVTNTGSYIKLTSFFLTETGHMLKEFSSHDSRIIQINPFSEIPPRGFLKDLDQNWRSDLQLMSMYLEFKTKRQEELKQQLDTPRLQQVLQDYILCIVKNKPKNVMNFTVDFVRKLERDGNAHEVYQTAPRRQQQN